MTHKKVVKIEKKFLEHISKAIFDITIEYIRKKEGIYTISIAGESGTGKTMNALALEKQLYDHDIKSIVFFQDAYFKYPPKENHYIRLKDIKKNVGPQEILWQALEEHIHQAKTRKYFQKKFIDYHNNSWGFHREYTEGLKVIIAEGTYATLLNDVDCRVFIEGSYKDTENIRKNRDRDIFDEHTNKILEAEHHIISKHRSKADLVFDILGNLKQNSFKS